MHRQVGASVDVSAERIPRSSRRSINASLQGYDLLTKVAMERNHSSVKLSRQSRAKESEEEPVATHS